MRTIPLNVNLDGAITPDNILAGYEGEHNVTKLDIYIASALTSSISFFRLALGDYLTDELYPENDKINYLLPGNVMFAPVLLIQLEGYKEKDGEIELVFKSDIVSAQIKPSLTAIHEIPKEMEQGLGGALAKLSYYVENSTELADAFSNMLEEAKEVLEQNSAEWDNKTAHATETMNALLNTGRAVLEETQNALASKANAATTLAGYNITDAYTKSETDIMLLEKANINGVYTKAEIDNALTSGMQELLKNEEGVFEEYIYFDPFTFTTTQYLYIEHPEPLMPNAKYKLKFDCFYDLTEVKNFCVCVGNINHPVIQNIPPTNGDLETYTFIEFAEFSLPETVSATDKIFFRFDMVRDPIARDVPYTLFASRLLPCYNKEQVDGLLESKADSSDVPTKVSELTNDSGYLVESDIVSKADKPSWRIIEDGETVTLADNTNYYVEGAISNLTINYPVDAFICSLELPLASSGDITITLPQSKYIGGKPTFANGETWELNIKNGVVVGGLVE